MVEIIFISKNKKRKHNFRIEVKKYWKEDKLLEVLIVKMKISELTTGQGNVDVEGTIKEFGEPRTFNKFGRELTVVNAVLEDDSGILS